MFWPSDAGGPTRKDDGHMHRCTPVFTSRNLSSSCRSWPKILVAALVGHTNLVTSSIYDVCNRGRFIRSPFSFRKFLKAPHDRNDTHNPRSLRVLDRFTVYLRTEPRSSPGE